MFNIRNVREAVAAKVAVIGNVDENVIHDLYARAMRTELESASRATRDVEAAALACVKCQQPGKWAMVDRAEWEALGLRIQALAALFR